MNQKITAKLIETIHDFHRFKPILGLFMIVYCDDRTRIVTDHWMQKHLGQTIKEFLDMETHETPKYAYKIFDIDKNTYHKGNIIKPSHPVFFTIEKSEVFYFILTNASENFGTYLLIASFQGCNDTHIYRQNADTEGTRTIDKFYVDNIVSLNDYDLIMDFYHASKYQSITDDDSDKSLYFEALKYYERHNCPETVRALKEIHDERKRKI